MTSPADLESRRPARRRAAALPPDERRTAIIHATIPLLLEHGTLVSTRQIAEAAGIAEGTIFRVFADKDAIVAAAVDAALDPAPFERQLETIDPTVPLHDIVTKAVVITQRRVAHTWRLLSSIEFRTQEHRRGPMPDSPSLTRLFEAHRSALAVPPRTAVRALRGLTVAMSHPMMVERPASAREITRLFLHGVLGPEHRC